MQRRIRKPKGGKRTGREGNWKGRKDGCINKERIVKEKE